MLLVMAVANFRPAIYHRAGTVFAGAERCCILPLGQVPARSLILAKQITSTRLALMTFCLPQLTVRQNN